MPPIAPRPAATVMLLRDAPTGLEVFMLRRNDALEFSPGAHVFPGGAVDPADVAPAIAGVCRGRTDTDASVQLEVDSGGLGYWVAAIRECFEEAGVLLARRADGTTVSLPDPLRRAVIADELSLADLCRDEGLELATNEVHYFGHWITPVGPPRRYDTRFFVTIAPVEQDAAHDHGEAVGSEWIRPEEALERGAMGSIGLIEPTLRSLSALTRFDGAGDVVSSVTSAVADDGTVAMAAETEGRRVRLPFDDSSGPPYPRGATEPVGGREW